MRQFSKYDMTFYNNRYHLYRLTRENFKGLLKYWI